MSSIDQFTDNLLRMFENDVRFRKLDYSREQANQATREIQSDEGDTRSFVEADRDEL